MDFYGRYIQIAKKSPEPGKILEMVRSAAKKNPKEEDLRKADARFALLTAGK